MKKFITIGLTATLLLTIGATTVFATDITTGTNYVDADNNGVCDNVGSGAGEYFTDANNDGACDNIGSGTGGYFADVNNDGTCDNIGTRQGASNRIGTGGNSNGGNGARRGQNRN